MLQPARTLIWLKGVVEFFNMMSSCNCCDRAAGCQAIRVIKASSFREFWVTSGSQAHRFTAPDNQPPQVPFSGM